MAATGTTTSRLSHPMDMMSLDSPTSLPAPLPPARATGGSLSEAEAAARSLFNVHQINTAGMERSPSGHGHHSGYHSGHHSSKPHGTRSVNPSGPHSPPAERSSGSPKPAGALRKGKWTAEEENYTSCIIQDFNKGYLPIVAGTTLRSFLSEKLNCDPMRITKKFAGASCIGKQVFQPCDPLPENERAIEIALKRRTELEVLFRNKIDSQKPSRKSQAQQAARKQEAQQRQLAQRQQAEQRERDRQNQLSQRTLEQEGQHELAHERDYASSYAGQPVVMTADDKVNAGRLTQWRSQYSNPSDQSGSLYVNVNDDGGMMHGVDAQHMENDNSPRAGAAGASSVRGGKGKEAAYGGKHGSAASGSQAAVKESYTYQVTPADRDAGGLLLDFFESVQRRASVGDEKDMCSPRSGRPEEQGVPLEQGTPAMAKSKAHPAHPHPAQVAPAHPHQAHQAQADQAQAHRHATRLRESADAYPFTVVTSDGSAPPPVALALALGMAKEAADSIPLGPTHAHMGMGGGAGGGGYAIGRSTGPAVPTMSEAAAAAREAEMEARRGNTPSPTTTVGSASTSGGNTPNSLEHLISEGRGMEQAASQPFDDNDACSSRATSASSSEKGDSDSSDEAERREAAAARGGGDNMKFDLLSIKRSERPGDAEDSNPMKKARSFDNLAISDHHRSTSDHGLHAPRTGDSDDTDSLPPPPPPPPPPPRAVIFAAAEPLR